jgi:hypothetical protein
MRPFAAALACVATLLSLTAAVFLDEAYQTDFHHALLGLPQQHTTFFHRPQAESKASLLYTLSEKAVLGAVNPKTGAIVWRQSLASASKTGPSFLRAGEDEDVVISAIGSEVRAWDALSGRLVWGNEFGDGVAADLEVIETAVETEPKRRKDAMVLFAGKSQGILRRLHGDNGDVVWEFHDKRFVIWSADNCMVNRDELTMKQWRCSLPGLELCHERVLNSATPGGQGCLQDTRHIPGSRNGQTNGTIHAELGQRRVAGFVHPPRWRQLGIAHHRLD